MINHVSARYEHDGRIRVGYIGEQVLGDGCGFKLSEFGRFEWLETWAFHGVCRVEQIAAFAKSYIAKSRGWVGSRGAHFYAAPFLIFKQKISHACWPSNGVWSIYCVPFQSGGFPLD